jgi:hypothetical protein
LPATGEKTEILEPFERRADIGIDRPHLPVRPPPGGARSMGESALDTGVSTS